MNNIFKPGLIYSTVTSKNSVFVNLDMVIFLTMEDVVYLGRLYFR